MLLGKEDHAPEFNQFVMELCSSVGIVPSLYRGTVDSIRGAVDLVAQRRCVLCAPASCVTAIPGLVWRPFTAPSACYPWSVLWRAGDCREHVLAVLMAACELSTRHDWVRPSGQHTDGRGPLKR
jgi:hypothetical protein